MKKWQKIAGIITIYKFWVLAGAYVHLKYIVANRQWAYSLRFPLFFYGGEFPVSGARVGIMYKFKRSRL